MEHTMNEFQKWLSIIEAIENYPTKAIEESIAFLQIERDDVMKNYDELTEELKALQEKLILIHAKRRYFEIKLEAKK